MNDLEHRTPETAPGPRDDTSDGLRLAEGLVRIQRDLSLALGACDHIPTALGMILDAALQMPGVDSGGIYVADATGALDLVSHRGLSPAFIEATSHYELEAPQARLAHAGIARYDTYRNLQAELSRRDDREGLRSLAVIPVCHHGRLITLMNLASHTCDEFPLATREALETMAQQVASTLVRLRADAALRESKRNLQTLFDTVEDFLFVLDGEGRILETNEAVVRRLGYRRDELLGQSVLVVHPEDRRDEAAAIVEGMLAGTCDICPVPLQTADGGLIPVETRVTPGVWGGKPAIFGLSRDISERVRAEEELRKANASLEIRVALRTAELQHMVDELKSASRGPRSDED